MSKSKVDIYVKAEEAPKLYLADIVVKGQFKIEYDEESGQLIRKSVKDNVPIFVKEDK